MYCLLYTNPEIIIVRLETCHVITQLSHMPFSPNFVNKGCETGFLPCSYLIFFLGLLYLPDSECLLLSADHCLCTRFCLAIFTLMTLPSIFFSSRWRQPHVAFCLSCASYQSLNSKYILSRNMYCPYLLSEL